MTMPEEVQVDVHKMWGHEALDFTPWLAEHLDLLGDAVGLKLELVQQEYAVGPFYLDILAEDACTGVMVAIENQMEETDHSHLGQLLTYATGCGAHVAIWVAPEFTYEHAEALHRLNEWTSVNVRFYGVKVEVVKVSGDPGLEPRLRKVVYPGGWDKEITLKSKEMPLTVRKYHYFFQPLTAKLLQEGFADSSFQYFDHTGRFFPSRINRHVGYAVSFWQNSAWVSLHIRTWDSIERGNGIFDELQADRQQIESSIEAAPEQEWVWDRHNQYSFCTINIRKDGSIDDCPEKLEETRAWMLDWLPKFKEVFDPRLDEILKRSASE